MGQTLLSIRRLDRIVGRPEVGDQYAVECLSEELQQGRTASATVNHVVTIAVIGKAPQPVLFPVHAPAGFIGMEMSRLLRLLADLLIPVGENLRQPLPGIDQSARRQLGVQMEPENVMAYTISIMTNTLLISLAGHEDSVWPRFAIRPLLRRGHPFLNIAEASFH